MPAHRVTFQRSASQRTINARSTNVVLRAPAARSTAPPAAGVDPDSDRLSRRQAAGCCDQDSEPLPLHVYMSVVAPFAVDAPSTLRQSPDCTPTIAPVAPTVHC